MKLHLFALILLLAVSGLAQAPPAKHGPLSKDEILELTRNYVPSQRLADLVQQFGINFTPDEDYLKSLREAGGEDVLIQALRAARPVQPTNATATSQANDAAVKQHLVRATDFKAQKDYAGAESEYRAAVALAPDRADIHFQLAYVMLQQQKFEASIPENREALRLRPEMPPAHNNLGYAYYRMGDLEEAKTEYREAVNLRPNYALAHHGLGVVLEKSGDLAGAAKEYRAACDIEPKNAGFRASCQKLAVGNAGGGTPPATPEVALTVDAVRFFPTGVEMPSENDRQYAVRFRRSSLRIGWELRFTYPQQPSRVNFDIEAVWYGPGGNLIHRQTYHTYIPAGTTASGSVSNWGCTERPCRIWEPGPYHVDFFRSGRKLATGSFEVR
jgi:tetratricopeptide (TPR) repeat protein